MRKVSPMEEEIRPMNVSFVAEETLFKKLFQVPVERKFPGTVLKILLREL